MNQRQEFELTIEGRGAVTVALKRYRTARRYTLRVCPYGKGVTVSVPPRGSFLQARAFAERHASWIKSKLQKVPQQQRVDHHDTIPLRGQPHQIVISNKLRGMVTYHPSEGEGLPQLIVPGAEVASKRLARFLRAEALQDLTRAVEFYAAALKVKPKKISIRDTTSRWGSCSSSGLINFSWRLILAPPFVLEYVAAHEVAHLREMNHSDKFWRLVEEVCPRTSEARAWLNHYGTELHRYQVAA